LWRPASACSQFHEWSIEEPFRILGLYEPFPEAKDGYLELSDRPGWGVEISPTVLADADYQVSTMD
jgi:L-alanine-DL-glutamate epimerase-like enolase superfamily enzyme